MHKQETFNEIKKGIQSSLFERHASLKCKLSGFVYEGTENLNSAKIKVDNEHINI